MIFVGLASDKSCHVWQMDPNDIAMSRKQPGSHAATTSDMRDPENGRRVSRRSPVCPSNRFAAPGPTGTATSTRDARILLGSVRTRKI
jgi:hypothetical protein